MDEYPAITIEEAHFPTETGTFSFKGSGVFLGRGGFVPLHEGWRLGQRPCGECGGEGSVDCPHEDRCAVKCEPCPSCHGVGGFPVLLRPCDEEGCGENCEPGMIYTPGDHGPNPCLSCFSSPWPGFVEVTG